MELVEEFQGATSPLFNHLVLNQIGDYLPIKDLFNARLVCKFWYEELSRRLTIEFNSEKHFKEFVFVEHVSKIPYIYFYFQPSYWDLWNSNWDSAWSVNVLFTQLSSSTTIRGITLPSLNHSWKTLLKILAPTLTSLKIVSYPLSRSIQRIYLNDQERPIILKCLKSLEIDLVINMANDNKSDDKKYFIKDILNSCSRSNLKELKMKYWIDEDCTLFTLDYLINRKFRLEKFWVSCSVFRRNVLALKIVEMGNSGVFKQIVLDGVLIPAYEFGQLFSFMTTCKKYPNLIKKCNLEKFTFLSKLHKEKMKRIWLSLGIPINIILLK